MHRRSLEADCERCTCMNCEYHSRSLSQISYDAAKSTFVVLSISTKYQESPHIVHYPRFYPQSRGLS